MSLSRKSYLKRGLPHCSGQAVLCVTTLLCLRHRIWQPGKISRYGNASHYHAYTVTNWRKTLKKDAVQRAQPRHFISSTPESTSSASAS